MDSQRQLPSFAELMASLDLPVSPANTSVPAIPDASTERMPMWTTTFSLPVQPPVTYVPAMRSIGAGRPGRIPAWATSSYNSASSNTGMSCSDPRSSLRNPNFPDTNTVIHGVSNEKHLLKEGFASNKASTQTVRSINYPPSFAPGFQAPPEGQPRTASSEEFDPTAKYTDEEIEVANILVAMSRRKDPFDADIYQLRAQGLKGVDDQTMYRLAGRHTNLEIRTWANEAAVRENAKRVTDLMVYTRINHAKTSLAKARGISPAAIRAELEATRTASGRSKKLRSQAQKAAAAGKFDSAAGASQAEHQHGESESTIADSDIAEESAINDTRESL